MANVVQLQAQNRARARALTGAQTRAHPRLVGELIRLKALTTSTKEWG